MRRIINQTVLLESFKDIAECGGDINEEYDRLYCALRTLYDNNLITRDDFISNEMALNKVYDKFNN